METKNFVVENGVLVEVDKEWEGEFVVPDGVWKLGGGAFDGREKVSKVVVPKSVLQIDSWCFGDCNADIEIESERYVFDGNCLIDKRDVYNGEEAATVMYCKNSVEEYIVPKWVKMVNYMALSKIGRLVMHEDVSPVSIRHLVREFSKFGGKILLPRMTNKLLPALLRSDIDEVEAVIELQDESGWKLLDESVVEYGALVRAPRRTEEYIVPSGVRIIEQDAFSWSRKTLRKVVMNETLKDIDDYAFEDCEALEEVVLPNGLDLLRSGVFCGCKSLKRLRIPKSVKEMEDNPFEGCSIDFEFEGDKWIYDGVLLIDSETKEVVHCRADAKEVRVPEWVEKINLYAFRGCKDLSCIILKRSVEVSKHFLSRYNEKIRFID